MPSRFAFPIPNPTWKAAIFDDAPVAIALVSPDNRFLACNRLYCAGLGYEESELIGTRWQDYTHPADISGDEHGAAQLQLSSEMDNYTVDKRYKRKFGGDWCVTLHVRSVWINGKFTACLVRAFPIAAAAQRRSDTAGNAGFSSSQIVQWAFANKLDAGIIGFVLAYWLGRERIIQLIEKWIF